MKEILYQIITNKWFYSFIVGWILFFALVDWNRLNRNLWGGIYVCILQLFQDNLAHVANIYIITDVGIRLIYTSAFFTFGIIFTMGVLFVQYLPRSPKLQLLHISAFVLGFLVFEYTVHRAGLLHYKHWSLVASFWDDILILTSLAWIKKFIYKY